MTSSSTEDPLTFDLNSWGSVSNPLMSSKDESTISYGNGIFTYMDSCFLMVNVGEYTIHGSYIGPVL